jgi:very-short-patch-repair endonuclease
MRREPTEPEKRLWMELRDSRLHGFKFRRQATLGRRIVDFFCPAKSLIIEIDGVTHDREADLARDAALALRTGFRTVRFTNHEVMTNMEGVKLVIREALTNQPDRWPARHHPPAPSSEEEGGEV